MPAVLCALTHDCFTLLAAEQKAADKMHAAICATPAVAFEPQGGWAAPEGRMLLLVEASQGRAVLNPLLAAAEGNEAVRARVF